MEEVLFPGSGVAAWPTAALCAAAPHQAPAAVPRACLVLSS